MNESTYPSVLARPSAGLTSQRTRDRPEASLTAPPLEFNFYEPFPLREQRQLQPVQERRLPRPPGISDPSYESVAGSYQGSSRLPPLTDETKRLPSPELTVDTGVMFEPLRQENGEPCSLYNAHLRSFRRHPTHLSEEIQAEHERADYPGLRPQKFLPELRYILNVDDTAQPLRLPPLENMLPTPAPQDVVERDILSTALQHVVERDTASTAPQHVVQGYPAPTAPQHVVQEHTVSAAPQHVVQGYPAPTAPQHVVQEHTASTGPQDVVQGHAASATPMGPPPRREATPRRARGSGMDDPERPHTKLQLATTEMMVRPPSTDTSRGDLHKMPFRRPPHAILDLWSGDGSWVLDMALLYPSAQVIGENHEEIVGRPWPPNAHFASGAINGPWVWSTGHFDLIRLRDPSFLVSDWPTFLTNVFSSLRPGGWVEISSSTWRLNFAAPVTTKAICDYNAMHDNGPQIVRTYGKHAEASRALRKTFADAGFVKTLYDRLDRAFDWYERLNANTTVETPDISFFQYAFGWDSTLTMDMMLQFKRTHQTLPEDSMLFDTWECVAQKPFNDPRRYAPIYANRDAAMTDA